MRNWFKKRKTSRPVPAFACAGCGESLPFTSLVPVNACYHDPHYGHAGCHGARVLCVDCHRERGYFAYYAAYFRVQGDLHPGQYPVEESLIGLDLYLHELERLIASGVDPLDQNHVEIAWHAYKRSPATSLRLA